MTVEDRERKRRIEAENEAWYLRLKERLIAEGKLRPKTPSDEPAPTTSGSDRAVG
jgi:hypothetical protein